MIFTDVDNPYAQLSELPMDLSEFLVGLVHGSIELAQPQFPDIAGWSWDGHEFSAQGVELEVTDDKLTMVVHADERDAHCNIWTACSALNRPCTLFFRDGSELRARIMNQERISGNPFSGHATLTRRFGLYHWEWVPRDGCSFWIGRVTGAHFDDSNLVTIALTQASRHCSARHLRVEGRNVLYLLCSKADDVFLIIDTRADAQNLRFVHGEFRALQFALGSWLGLSMLRAVTLVGNVIGAAGLSLEDCRKDDVRRCPVPELLATGRWTAALASRVAKTLANEDDESSPVRLGITAYLDSLSGHVHKRYLLAQIAVEAIAGEILRDDQNRVLGLTRDTSKWRDFVNDHENQIRALARDDASAEKLLNKLRHNVHESPKGDLVLAALDRLQITIPEVIKKELKERNSVAHEFVMFHGDGFDVQELADRIARIQTLLTSMIAKLVGYTGPVVGWELENGQWKEMDWCGMEEMPDAHVRFLAKGSNQ